MGKIKINRGFSLVEVIVGTALMLVIFVGLFEAYRMVFKMIGQSRSRITATSLSNKQIETARNLPYSSVGVVGGFPEGVLESSTTTVSNNILFTIENRVDFVVDSSDGVASPEDDCPNDYKRIETKVSWSDGFGGEVVAGSDIAPENLSQECSSDGGILSVSVFDSHGQMVFSPLIEIKDPLTGEVVKSASPSSGQHYFSLATSTYKISVSASGFSSENTYASGDIYGGTTIITPEKPNLAVLEGLLSQSSLSIDRTGVFSVDTSSPWGSDSFSDSFVDESKILEKSDVAVSSGDAMLAIGADGYFLSGYLLSVGSSPVNISNWDEFSFSDNEPAGADLKYQIYYSSSTDWYLVPEEDLAGNSEGFDISPVDLSGLPIADYAGLRLKANFSTESTTTTSVLENWSLSWITSDPTPIPGATFSLRGEKSVGDDEFGDPIYKYLESFESDSSGHKDISDLEWDSYTFSTEPAGGLNLVDINPSPQPIGLSPLENISVVLYLDSSNSCLITLEDDITLEPIFSGSIRMYNSGLGYDETQYTDERGQTLFIPLDAGTYNLEISGPGYASENSSVSVSGNTLKTIGLEQVE
ncbi:MAG: prepilin-type N-terminal cleavage/methylation domain-containing protein [Candidatus Pacebacteria bacterium]|nr:prepilin-type N-terminal cleavage/methylation domain-containing protein [Candidatus Paceibacterota bacterium]